VAAEMPVVTASPARPIRLEHFRRAASCEEIGELVVSAVLAETLKKIAAIETAKNFIVGS
jgi:hypothetical protein